MKRNKGFGLIELIVALAIFSVIVVVMATIASSVIQSQRKVFALQSAQETGRYVLESMVKEIRQSQINSADSGGNPINVLNITNSASETFDYQFDNTNKRLLRNGFAVSPSDVEVTGNFYIKKNDFPSYSVITIVMKMERTSAKPEEKAKIYIQSTVTPRTF